jgi:hypothetical protein
MDARRTQRTTASRGDRRHKAHRAWILAILALAALVQACTDNNGKAPGPTFPAGTAGFASTGADLRVQVAVNPNTIEVGRRAGITVLVTNLNGRGIQGKHVQLSTSAGALDVVDGFTDLDGKFVSFLKISASDTVAGQTSATITAFVEGATGTAQVFFGTAGPLILIPTVATQTTGATVSSAGPAGQLNTCPTLAGFTVTFTVSGGVPPYTFSASGSYPGASFSNGVYTAPTLAGPFGIAPPKTDTVTVVDSVGATATATINFGCVAAFGT